MHLLMHNSSSVFISTLEQEDEDVHVRGKKQQDKQERKSQAVSEHNGKHTNQQNAERKNNTRIQGTKQPCSKL